VTNIISIEPVVKSIYVSHAKNINSLDISQDMELLVIPYASNQSADL